MMNNVSACLTFPPLTDVYTSLPPNEYKEIKAPIADCKTRHMHSVSAVKPNSKNSISG